MLKENFKKTPIAAFGFRKTKENKAARENSSDKVQVPDGLFKKCSKCNKIIYMEDIVDNRYICPECGYYFKVTARARLSMVLDRNTFEEWDTDLITSDPLKFPGYKKKLEKVQAVTDLDEAVLTGRGKIRGQETAIGVMSSDFLMGSMGSVVGEKITRLFEKATQAKLPVILFCCSGGARMQEGTISLMQMAKTSQAVKRHSDAGLMYISFLTDPTTGGVTASFAMLGDVILAEPEALIGFAGPRVIEQTIKQKLPEGFQRAEFLVKHGFVDRIVKRKSICKNLAYLLMYGTHGQAQKMGEKRAQISQAQEDAAQEEDAGSIPAYAQEKKPLSAWDRVLLARNKNRPYAMDYMNGIFDGFMELHGDRLFGDDGAIIGGIASIAGQLVTVIGQQKGRSIKQNVKRNFGMPSPEGYRKAMRLMRQAEKFRRPVICFVDTPGAFCGMEAEERGQGQAIAENLYEMSALKIPILSIVIGEGGSGGALAMAVANEVWMLENSMYSVLSPEGFASILWKDGSRAEEAAKMMKCTANELKKLGVVDKIIKEEQSADVNKMEELNDIIKCEIIEFLKRYREIPGEKAAQMRYERFRKF